MNVNIIGIKEASGDLAQIMRIIKGKPENFLVISGDDMLTLPIIAAAAPELSQCWPMPILLSAE